MLYIELLICFSNFECRLASGSHCPRRPLVGIGLLNLITASIYQQFGPVAHFVLCIEFDIFPTQLICIIPMMADVGSV